MNKVLNVATQTLLMADWGTLVEGILAPMQDFINSSWLIIVGAAVTVIVLYLGIIGVMYALSNNEDKATERKAAIKRGVVGMAIIVVLAILVFTIPNILVGIIESSGSDIWD